MPRSRVCWKDDCCYWRCSSEGWFSWWCCYMHREKCPTCKFLLSPPSLSCMYCCEHAQSNCTTFKVRHMSGISILTYRVLGRQYLINLKLSWLKLLCRCPQQKVLKLAVGFQVSSMCILWLFLAGSCIHR